MRKASFGPAVCFLLLARVAAPSQGSAATPWALNEQEYLERPGVSVLVFHNTYPEGRQGGIEIVQHGERVASVGDVRLDAAPGQWGRLPKVGPRAVDRTRPSLSVPGRFEAERLDYRVTVTPCGEDVCVEVDLASPLPASLAGRAGFNLQLFPPAYFAKTYQLGSAAGVFPLQANGPLARDPALGLRSQPLASGPRLVVAAEDPLRRLSIESSGGDLLLLDGRDSDSHGWFVVRTPIPVGASHAAVKWRISIGTVADWRRPPVIGISQVGYHPAQEKRAVVELDPRASTLGEATLLRVDADRGVTPVLRQPLERWGRFLRYEYAVFDFSSVREPGLYAVRYGEQQTPPFRIATDVFRHGVWQPTLEVFFPVQMCHMRVAGPGRVWHGACHLDDALQSPAGHDLSFIEGYRQGPTTDTRFAAYEHIPGLDRGGWHDAGDYDLAAGSHAGTTLVLALAREAFGLDSDQTRVDQARREVELHVPDGSPDILQQIAHGAENLLGGHRAAGHSFGGITDATLAQYIMVGDASTMTDNRVFDPALGPDEVREGRSGRRDERMAFTSRDTALEYQVAAALAAASRVLPGFDDRLAEECRQAAVRSWDYEHSHPPVQQPSAYHPERIEEQEILAGVELLLATRERRYAERLAALLPAIEAQVDRVGWSVARAVPLAGDTELSRRLEAALTRYASQLREKLAANPYGVPFEPEIWGVTWEVQRHAVAQYFLHRAYPRLFERENVLRAVSYVLGCHPASNTSLVSGVGAHSLTVAYGTNLNEWSHIPGGGVSGPALIRPDLPELKEPFPFLWQQAEYVIGGAATYLFSVLAADQLVSEP